MYIYSIHSHIHCSYMHMDISIKLYLWSSYKGSWHENQSKTKTGANDRIFWYMILVHTVLANTNSILSNTGCSYFSKICIKWLYALNLTCIINHTEITRKVIWQIFNFMFLELSEWLSEITAALMRGETLVVFQGS